MIPVARPMVTSVLLLFLTTKGHSSPFASRVVGWRSSFSLVTSRSCKRRPGGYLKEVRAVGWGYTFNVKSTTEIFVLGYNN